MAASGNLFASVYDMAFTGKITWSGTVKIALLSNAASPSLTWRNFSDVTGEITGQGYTAGGMALGSLTHTVTAANAWGNVWAPSTPYQLGAIVRPATGNGYLYQAVVAGTTGSSVAVLNSGPTIIGQTVTDGSVTWTCIGESITQFSSGAATWTNATISASYAVIYDASSGSAASSPLICLQGFSAQPTTSTNGNFTTTPNALGWFYLTPQ